MTVRVGKTVRDALWSGLVVGGLGAILFGGVLVLGLADFRAGIAQDGILSWIGLSVASVVVSVLLNLGIAVLCLRALRRPQIRDLRRLRGLAWIGAILGLASPSAGLVLMVLLIVRTTATLRQAHPMAPVPTDPA